MTRPSKGGDNKRETIIRVRVTLTEKKQLAVLAENAGLTASDFIRVKTIGGTPIIKKATPERAVLIKGLGELGKIGSNVNQIARALNRRDELGERLGVSKELIEYALQGVRTLTKHLTELLGHDGHSG